MYKYNRDTSVRDFLERIEEIKSARRISTDYLLRAVPEIFTQEALVWYQTRHFASWDDLTSQSREVFFYYDYEDSLSPPKASKMNIIPHNLLPLRVRPLKKQNLE